eukprot:3345481-Prymnesium_polylepis.1
MMRRLDEVADELGIDRREARVHGHNAMASGRQYNWAEKQLRTSAGAVSVGVGEMSYCLEKRSASTAEEGRSKGPMGPPKKSTSNQDGPSDVTSVRSARSAASGLDEMQEQRGAASGEEPSDQSGN